MTEDKGKGPLPLYKRIVFWMVLPVVVVGVLISALVTSYSSAPMEAYLKRDFEDRLLLASALGIGVCDKHFNQLLEMRLEDNQEMNQSRKSVALREIEAIARQVPKVHLMVLENGRRIQTISIDFSNDFDGLPYTGSQDDTIREFRLAGTAVKGHSRYFPFWGWHIVSFVKQTDFMAPIQAAHRIIYLSTLGMLLAVCAILLFVFHRFVTGPLHRLIAATKDISRGELATVQRSHDNEIGQLVIFFNRMVESLRSKNAEVSHLIERLTESEERYRRLVELFPEAVLIVQDGEIKYFNHSGADLFGAGSAAELIGKPVETLIHPDFRDSAYYDMKAVVDEGTLSRPRELKCLRLDQKAIDIEATATHIEYAGRPALLNVFRDVSERKRTEAEKARLEEQLSQAQKIESLGRLAGGVAHDLNNLLSPILGYTEMMLEDTNRDEPGRQALNQIFTAGHRARKLVRQLLAFGRKQTLEFKAINLNDLLADFENLLRRTIREDIAIRRTFTQNLPPVKGDTGQIEQVVMNLAVNAQDAMPHGGVLSIETERIKIPRPDAAFAGTIAPGEYVLLRVSDTGTGLEETARQHLFEPFFTTKEKGQGTGLGLATVYGIVKQHDGHIQVDSKTDFGTTFRIYLPVFPGAAEPAPEKAELSTPAGGKESILLVEDDQQVRLFVLSFLQKLGYMVLSAENAEAALELLDRRSEPLDLLLTDVIMPGMNGKQLFEAISERYPSMRVLYMSGYTDNVIAHHGVLEEGVPFIEKPFSVKALAAKVRQLMEQKK